MTAANHANVRDYGCFLDVNGIRPDNYAFQDAAATGLPVYIPYGSYLITEPITFASDVFGDGCDTNQSEITFAGNGCFLTADSDAHWSGFRMVSSTNDLTMVKVAHHGFKLDHFFIEGTGSGQIGIQFDTGTVANLHHCKLSDFRFTGVDTPVKIVGSKSFINNHLGDLGDSWNEFVNALHINNTLVFGLNHVGGYFEGGTNAIYYTGGADPSHFRSNFFEMHCDNPDSSVLNTLYSTKDINGDWPSVWAIPRQVAVFTAASGKTIGAQKFASKPAAFRTYLGTDMTGTAFPDDTATKILFAVESFDTIDCFDATTNNRYAAPYAQKMAFHAQANVSTNLATGDRVDLWLYKNGAAHSQVTNYCAGSNGTVIQISDVLDLAKGDYVEVWVKANQTAGASSHGCASGSAATYFTGHEL